MAGAGHNAPIAVKELQALMERIEALDDERAAIGEQTKSLYAEAKGSGFDTKAMRRLVALRRKDRDKVVEDKAMLELYASALGCLDLV